MLEIEHLGDLPVSFLRIDAGFEEGYVVRPQFVGARTGRIALARSGLRVGLRKPGNDHGLHAAVVREAVRLPIRTGQAEVGGEVAGLQHSFLRTVTQNCHRRAQ
jgi:hypothetical protein